MKTITSSSNLLKQTVLLIIVRLAVTQNEAFCAASRGELEALAPSVDKGRGFEAHAELFRETDGSGIEEFVRFATANSPYILNASKIADPITFGSLLSPKGGGAIETEPIPTNTIDEITLFQSGVGGGAIAFDLSNKSISYNIHYNPGAVQFFELALNMTLALSYLSAVCFVLTL